MNSEVKRILEAVSGSIGRNIFIYDESFLLKSLARRLTKNAIENMSAYLDFVTDNSAEGAEFFRSLNITYSEFFRDPLTFCSARENDFAGTVPGKGKVMRDRDKDLVLWLLGRTGTLFRGDTSG